MSVISLELNELNFHFVEKFVAAGELPHFARLLRETQLFETDAEKSYPHLEPWIQWPTVYTGMTFAQHQIFRLGDAVNHGHRQIWEDLEAHGVSVGAVSPMNAPNRCANPDFFLPDPWTETPLTAPPRVAKLFELVRTVVNNNAAGNLSVAKLGRELLPLAFPFVNKKQLPSYLPILKKAVKYKWAKAAFLDRLLVDLFTHEVRRLGTQYASLFLNAGAHIQHHHMYDSAAYDGERRNPAWYSAAAENDVDPLLCIYRVYDDVVGELRALPGVRLMITTGLSQVANQRDHYQYRIADFDRLFQAIDLANVTVQPLMSRDFLLKFPNAAATNRARELLEGIYCEGESLFRIENRGESLFCQVGYFGAPEGLKAIEMGGSLCDRSADFVLVSIENGIHQTIGYHFDTAVPKASAKEIIPLTEVHGRLRDAGLAQAVAKAA
jgi:hypothetical protein